MKKRSAAKSPIKESIVDQERPPDMLDNGRRGLIAMEAFELYEQRGRLDGHDLEDWLKAETIIDGTTE